MVLKEIVNEKDGNNIERIIYERIRRHIFMLFPFANVQVRIVSVLDDNRCEDGEYVYLVSEKMDLIMRLHPYHIQKMICQEFYNPFFEDSLRPILKNYIEAAGKKTPANVVDINKNKPKPCMWVYFHNKKPNVLKRLLGGLGL